MNAAKLKKIFARESGVSKYLPYNNHLDDVTIRLADGALMQSFVLEGFAFETADTEELNHRLASRETLFRAISNRQYTLYHHIVRRKVDPELYGNFPDPVSRAIDTSWRSKFQQRQLYINELYISLIYRPGRGKRGALSSITSRTRSKQAREATDLRRLTGVGDSVIAALRNLGTRRLRTVTTSEGAYCEQLSMLSSILHGDHRPVLVPQMRLGEYLPYRRLAFTQNTIHQLGAAAQSDRFGAVISVKDYPSITMPGILDGLLRAPCELVVSESFQFMERQSAEERVSLSIRRLQSADDDTRSLREGLISAKDQLVSGELGFGEHHVSVVVWADEIDHLDHAAASIQTILGDAGAIAVREDLNMEPAFWAQFPGNEKFIARKAMISTHNFAGFCSCHAFPTGQKEKYFWEEPICLFETTSSTPYYFDFHQGDLGNFLIVGPSGSGKTVYLNFLLSQARKLRPNTVFFDKDRGAEIFIRALGGRYETLRAGERAGFNPLMLNDSPANRAFLREWVATLLRPAQGELNDEEMDIIANAVEINFSQEPALRCLSVFAELLAGSSKPSSQSLYARIQKWIGHGEHAWLFDNAEDKVDLSHDLVGFDMSEVLDHPDLRAASLMYLFHRVEERLNGERSIIVIDEGWKALDDPHFQYRLKDWLKTIRKRNGIVGFVTQSLADAVDSPISAAIVEQTAMQMYLPNARARPEEYQGRLALSDHEFEILKALPDSSRCVLIKKGRHSVVARLDLSDHPDVLKILSGRESSVRELDLLRARLGDRPQDWLPVFLNLKGAFAEGTPLHVEPQNSGVPQPAAVAISEAIPVASDGKSVGDAA